MSGGLPRLRLPVTPQSIAIAGSFASACARTLDASESTIEAVRLVVSELATSLLRQAGATMIIEAEVYSGDHALVVRREGESVNHSDTRAIRELLLAAGVIIESDRWVIPITESAQ